MSEKILLVEDDQKLLNLLADELADNDYQVFKASNVSEATATFNKEEVSVVVTDLNLPDGSGFDVISETKKMLPHPGVILITAYGSIPQAVEALKCGADEFLTKPVNFEHFLVSISKLVDTFRLRNAIRKIKQNAGTKNFHGMIGHSRSMVCLFQEIEQIAKANGPVLISGESGTGKELTAKAIHDESDRKDKPFLAINCATLPADLMDSEFFGHEKGSFTGAVSSHHGLFHNAHGGTLFLDEIGEMPLTLQAKLLRALQEKKIRPVGGSKEYEIDVRVIAATNLDLERQVEKKEFREDLYYRLETFEIYLPPLRDRRDDIEMLVAHFLNVFSLTLDKPCPHVSGEALAAFKQYDFPGNIRELANAVERALTFCDNGGIELSDLPKKIREFNKTSLPEVEKGFLLLKKDEALPTIAELERNYAKHVLQLTDGNKKRTAHILGIGRKTLYRWLSDDPPLSPPE